MINGQKAKHKIFNRNLLPVRQAVKLVRIIECGHGQKNNALKFLAGYWAFLRAGQTVIAQQLLSIAVSEIKHLSALNSLIEKYGYVKSFVTIEKHHSFCNKREENLKKILIELLSLKRAIVVDYEKLIGEMDSCEIISCVNQIVLEEKQHVQLLESLINQLK